MPASLLLAPVVRVRRLLNPRLEYVCPFAKGNALAEARRLNRAGYSSAAVLMARIAVERRLHEITVHCPKVIGPKRRNGIGRYCSTLFAVGVLQKHETKLIEKFADKASPIVHGTATSRLHARSIIKMALRLLSMMEKRAS